MAKKLVILKTGRKIDTLDTIEGDYEDWIREGMGLTPAQTQVVDVAAEERLPPLEEVAAVAVTGSGAMVTEQDAWMLRSAEWLRQVVDADIPVLGICFGHQLLAYALGGQVDDNPRGVEVGTVTIQLTPAASEDPLFSSLPEQFSAQVSHSQSVTVLPPGATLLACSDMEPHQAFAWGKNTWGIQFHPEFDLQIIPHFIEFYRDKLKRQGCSVEGLLKGVTSSPHSESLLQRFAVIMQADSHSA